MIIMVYAAENRKSIAENLGEPQYSYFFAMEVFLPVLARMGIVVQLQDPAVEVDAIHELARQIGEDCVFLSFTPPHLMIEALVCPTIPVFPIEYYDLPEESWNRDPRNDWRWVLGRVGQAITHSEHACTVVRRALPDACRVAAIASPVWDRFMPLRRPAGTSPGIDAWTVRITGDMVDSRTYQPPRQPTGIAFSAAATLTLEPGGQLVSAARWRASRQFEIDVSGVVYTAIFNSRDGRKNWHDILRAFCRALRDRPDATLLLKIVRRNEPDFRYHLINEFQKLSPFDCRVVMIDAFLDEHDYAALIRNSTYTVNAASGEGQCLPLMEAMSAGVPAIAPQHTAMADYVDRSNAFLVNSTFEPATWPHDPRHKLRTRRHRIDAQSLEDAFAESYHTARHDPLRYWEMSRRASERLERHCSQRAVEQKLRGFLSAVPRVGKQPQATVAPRDPEPPYGPGRKAALRRARHAIRYSQLSDPDENGEITFDHQTLVASGRLDAVGAAVVAEGFACRGNPQLIAVVEITRASATTVDVEIRLSQLSKKPLTRYQFVHSVRSLGVPLIEVSTGLSSLIRRLRDSREPADRTAVFTAFAQGLELTSAKQGAPEPPARPSHSDEPGVSNAPAA